MLNFKFKNSQDDVLPLSILVYFSLNVLSAALFAVFFFCTHIYLLFAMELLFFIVHLAWGIRIPKDANEKVAGLIPYYFAFVSVYLLPFVLCLWKLDLYTGILWYALVPLGIKFHVDRRSLKGWILFSAVLAVSAIVLRRFIEVNWALSSHQIVFFNSCNTIFCATYIYVCLYRTLKSYRKKIKSPQLPSQDIPAKVAREHKSSPPAQIPEPVPSIPLSQPTLPTDKDNKGEAEKFIPLFKKICEYFKKHKPYLSAHFDVSKLAHDLNTNVNYITKAIKYNTGNNFNWFVNSYRIQYIQKLFENEKYTAHPIDILRSKAGFKNQSTFNDVFKKQIGMTPSEYIENLANIKKQSDGSAF